MPSYKRPISITYHQVAAKTDSGLLALPNLGGATDISAVALTTPRSPYDSFKGIFSYAPAKDHGWHGQDVTASFAGYWDESDQLWARRIDVSIDGDRFATLHVSNGGMPFTIALDHLPKTIDALGVNAEGSAAGDYLTGGRSSDVLRGMAGHDFLGGGLGDDILVGGKDGDSLSGGNGADTLIGGQGRDHLTGGKGADVFEWRADYWTEWWGNGNRDVIEDFGGSDRIDLRDIDARGNTAKNEAFVFIGSERFSGKSGELRYIDGLVRGDTDGDGLADFKIDIANNHDLRAADFLL